MNNQQLDLWHDNLGDALRAVVMAAGGPKKIGSELWPTRKIEDAARLLNHCLDDDRAEKLGLAEIEHILKRGRALGIHTGMAYLAQSCGYEQPKPVNPESEKERLQREFIQSVALQAELVKKMTSL